MHSSEQPDAFTAEKVASLRAMARAGVMEEGVLTRGNMELPAESKLSEADEQALIELLETEKDSHEVCHQTLRVLSLWGGEMSADAVIKCLSRLGEKEHDPKQSELRQTCLIALKTIGGPKAFEVLEQMAKDPFLGPLAKWCAHELNVGGTIDPTMGITAQSRAEEIRESTHQHIDAIVHLSATPHRKSPQ